MLDSGIQPDKRVCQQHSNKRHLSIYSRILKEREEAAHVLCFILRLFFCVFLRIRFFWLWWLFISFSCRFSRFRSDILLVVSRLEYMMIVPFLHEKLLEMVPTVEDTIQGSIGGMCEVATCMSTPKAILVIAFPFQCHLVNKQKFCN